MTATIATVSPMTIAKSLGRERTGPQLSRARTLRFIRAIYLRSKQSEVRERSATRAILLLGGESKGEPGPHRCHKFGVSVNLYLYG